MDEVSSPGGALAIFPQEGSHLLAGAVADWPIFRRDVLRRLAWAPNPALPLATPARKKFDDLFK